MADSKFYVDVPLLCSRRKKEYPVRVPIEEAQAMVETAAKKSRMAEELRKQLAALPNLPDAVLLYKGQCVILANVNEKSDDAVKRALNQALGEDVFEVPEPTPRAKKDKSED